MKMKMTKAEVAHLLTAVLLRYDSAMENNDAKEIKYWGALKNKLIFVYDHASSVQPAVTLSF